MAELATRKASEVWCSNAYEQHSKPHKNLVNAKNNAVECLARPALGLSALSLLVVGFTFIVGTASAAGTLPSTINEVVSPSGLVSRRWLSSRFESLQRQLSAASACRGCSRRAAGRSMSVPATTTYRRTAPTRTS